MFKFLNFSKKKNAPIIESQRECFVRLVDELNDAISALHDKPAVTIDPASGQISFKLPDQFPDEALALPAPEAPASPPQETKAQAPDVAPDEEKLDEKAA